MKDLALLQAAMGLQSKGNILLALGLQRTWQDLPWRSQLRCNGAL